MYSDYLIIGQGLAGSVLHHQLEMHGHSSVVVDRGTHRSASWAAVGLYNPIVLKRMKLVADAKEYLEYFNEFHARLSEISQQDFRVQLPVAKALTTVEDENQWMEKTGLETFSSLISKDIREIGIEGIIPSRFGIVENSGRLDVRSFLSFTRDKLRSSDYLMEEEFDWSSLRYEGSEFFYKEYRFGKLVICNGFSSVSMGFEMIQPNKGEVIEVSPKNDLRMPFILKGSVFCCPFGENKMAVGATYNRKDVSDLPSEDGLKQLKESLSRFATFEYSVTDHWAGIRPTVPDRKPLIGSIHNDLPIFCMNGLGSRGALTSPKLAFELIDLMENQKSIRKEVDVNRYSFSFHDFLQNNAQIC